MRTNFMYAIPIAAAVVATGCGGAGTMAGGSNLSSGLTGISASPAAVSSVGTLSFATSAPSTRFSHAWVTVYSVSMVRANGTSTEIFHAKNGRVVDLAKLNDPAGLRFTFLGKSSVAPVGFTSMSVIASMKTTITNTGAAKGTVRLFSPTLAMATNKNLAQFKFPLTTTTGIHSLSVDMNLRAWSVNSAGKVVAAMKQGSIKGAGDPTRQEHEDFEGQVANLTGTAPTQSFGLGNLTVNTDANTQIFNSDGSPNPALANGEQVKVIGVLSNNSIQATSIKIQMEGDQGNQAEVQGGLVSVDGTAQSIVMSVNEAENFQPPSGNLTVTTNANTIFCLGGQKMTAADFFTALATAPSNAEVDAEGAFDGTNLVASKLRVHLGDGGGGGGGGGGDQAQAGGTLTSFDGTAQSFVMNVQNSEGFTPPSTSLNVTTNANTVFEVDDNKVSAADFFTALGSAPANAEVEAEGSFDGTNLVASKAQVSTGH